MRKAIRTAVSIVAGTALVAGLSGCSSTTAAATVNGQELPEEEVTTYIEQLRTGWGVEGDDENWAYYLSMYGYTPGTIRDAAIDSLAQNIVVQQKADELGVSVSDEDIDSEVQTTRDQLGYTDDTAWTEALQSAGYADENDYRDAVKDALLQEALCEQEVEHAEVTDDEVASMAIYAAGEKASHILVSDEETANSIAETINASDDKDAAFAEALSQTEDTGDSAYADEDGNLGWTTINYQVYNYYLTNIASQLAEMNVGDVAVVSEDDGYHVVYCTDKFEVPDDATSVAFDDIPDDLAEEIREEIDTSNYDSDCSTYVSDLVDEAEIEVSDFPKDLSYDVDMSSYITVGTDDGTGQQTTDESTGETLYFADNTGLYYYKVVEDESSSDDSSSDSSDSSSDDSSSSSEETETVKTYVSYVTTAASFEATGNTEDEDSSSDSSSSSDETSSDSSSSTAVELMTDDQGTYYLDSDGNKVYVETSDESDSSSTSDESSTDDSSTSDTSN